MKVNLLLFVFLTITRLGLAVDAYCEFARCSDETVQFYNGGSFIHGFKASGKLYDIEATEKLRALGMIQPTEVVMRIMVRLQEAKECVFPQANLTAPNTCSYGGGEMDVMVKNASGETFNKTISILGYRATELRDELIPEARVLSIAIQIDYRILNLGDWPAECYFKQ